MQCTGMSLRLAPPFTYSGTTTMRNSPQGIEHAKVWESVGSFIYLAAPSLTTTACPTTQILPLKVLARPPPASSEVSRAVVLEVSAG